jgi:hypothetical protein
MPLAGVPPLPTPWHREATDAGRVCSSGLLAPGRYYVIARRVPWTLALMDRPTVGFPRQGEQKEIGQGNPATQLQWRLGRFGRPAAQSTVCQNQHATELQKTLDRERSPD